MKADDIMRILNQEINDSQNEEQSEDSVWSKIRDKDK